MGVLRGRTKQSPTIGRGRNARVARKVLPCEEIVHDSCDEHDKTGSYGKVKELEGQRSRLAPSNVWVVGSQYALGEDEVDDEKENNASVCKDIGGDGDARVGRIRSPCNAQDVCGYTGHAETEEEA
ncbi:hypothetical protein HG531_010524 [Fusarium graminearum]|nr:hypothetical protein HG531_010524 [Fusarium graminearum]